MQYSRQWIRTGCVICALVLLLQPRISSAASIGTTYDMDFFLNQTHPFDIAPQPADTTDGEDGSDLTPVDGTEDDRNDRDALDDLNVNDLDEGDDADVADDNDPLEPVNRVVFGFNSIVETVLYRPVFAAYNTVVPDFGRNALASFLSNLSSPVVLANDLMQGEFLRAFETGQRTLINTTIGVGGLWDAADWMGIPYHKEDFGQTLAVWGVGEGTYIVLPFIGPSNPRDLIGQFGVDSFIDPVAIYLDNEGEEEWQYARIGASALVGYSKIAEQLEQLEETSPDYYAAVRSLYRQRRNALIQNQAGSGTGTGSLYNPEPDSADFE